MKRALWLVLLSACAGGRLLSGPVAGQRAPDFTLPDLAGKKVSLGALAGKVVVVDFWASWCEPCQKELPELQKIADEMGPKVAVLALNIDKDHKVAADAAQALHLSVPVLLDTDGKVAQRYNPPKMPTSYVVGKNGTLLSVHEGFDGAGDVARLRQELGRLAQE